jgi:hypothetical protein
MSPQNFQTAPEGSNMPPRTSPAVPRREQHVTLGSHFVTSYDSQIYDGSNCNPPTHCSHRDRQKGRRERNWRGGRVEDLINFEFKDVGAAVVGEM